MTQESKRRVLVTGAAGYIGSYFAEHSSEKYDLRLMVREQDWAIDRIRPFGEVVYADLSSIERLQELFEGVDAIVHLAANPRPDALWNDLLEPNIIGTYNVFTAAVAAKVRRVIYASSVHAVAGYPDDVQVKTGDPVNPPDLYGVAKCFGEALARYMSSQQGLSAIVVRIGAYKTVERGRMDKGPHLRNSFVSKRDLNQLLHRCIDVEDLPFAILHGVSDNQFKRLDISTTRDLVGYDPQDDVLRDEPLP
ncbi:TDP-glucose-4,6-dehydratase [Capsulimonas corticalis]|uniref:TDP-glucose-4,6-dehydratase n=1 Tax=Capsulimonas corticalis TaxID=2219043 RepID=A0A402CT83_9BACT|nr:NAD(P)-dependent oxidoreductase [Capsulimonas corticalis]BDI30833.1 TDP-glucose-4,6-dehydratase [Capsulimonas corticalis]